MRLLVDIGNSRCKAAIDDHDGLRPLETIAWNDVFLHEALDDTWLRSFSHTQPMSVVVSNVAGDRLLPNLTDWCRSRLGVEPVSVSSAAQFQGLKNGYQDPSSFGVDRWAALIGARAEYAGGLCVIDSGTATTVDIVTADGQHLGGAILPGAYTMRRSLGKYTSALFAADGEINPFSDNTAGGIAGGTGFALVGAVDRLVTEASARVTPLTTIVTGGESGLLRSLMTHTAIHDPLLVLKGVAEMGADVSLAHLKTEPACQQVPVT